MLTRPFCQLTAIAACATLGCQQILGIEVGQGRGGAGGATGGMGATGGGGGEGGGGGSPSDGGSGGCAPLVPGSVLSLYADYTATVGESDVYAVALTADGRVVMAGTFNQTIGFGGMQLSNGGTSASTDGFVVTFDPVGGGYSNLVQLGGLGDVEPRDLAVAPDGTVYVVGSFRGELSLPTGAPADAPTGTTGGFVVQISPNGVASIAHSFLMEMFGSQAVVTGASYDEGALWIAGHFNGTMTIDGEVPGLSSTKYDVFIGVRSLASGSLSVRHVDMPGDDRAAGIAALGDGTALVAGTHDDTFEGYPTHGADDVWVGVALPELPPALDMRASYGGLEPDGVGGVSARDGQGALVLHHGRGFDLDGVVYGAPGFAVVSLDGAGPGLAWVRETPLIDEGEVMSTGIVLGDGAVVATGFLRSPVAQIDFADNQLPLSGEGADETGILVSYGPGGEHRYSAAVAATGTADEGNSVVRAVDGDGCRMWFGGRIGRGARTIARHDGAVTAMPQQLVGADALLFETAE